MKSPYFQAPVLMIDSRPEETWPYSGEIQIRDLEVRYRPGLDLVLDGVTCQIKAGEKVAGILPLMKF